MREREMDKCGKGRGRKREENWASEIKNRWGAELRERKYNKQS